MDEQPESASTCARFRPEPQTEEQKMRWVKMLKEADIGCCGFPLPNRVVVSTETEPDDVAVVTPKDSPAGDIVLEADAQAASTRQGALSQQPVTGVLLPPGLASELVDDEDSIVVESHINPSPNSLCTEAAPQENTPASPVIKVPMPASSPRCSPPQPQAASQIVPL
mmetsp:Transcript_23876/g.75391  ORF Transcript_23876/g.75391 Transcript_23876/m.75391 type:complete len:167 (+) Transcript_23876:1-501(+)